MGTLALQEREQEIGLFQALHCQVRLAVLEFLQAVEATCYCQNSGTRLPAVNDVAGSIPNYKNCFRFPGLDLLTPATQGDFDYLSSISASEP